MSKGHGKILVVEDECLIRLALCDFLECAGYEVLEAGEVLSAVGLFGSHDQIRAVISDIDMPGALNGIDLVNLIARTAAHVRIVITSARDPHDCMGLPDNAVYLQKPYREEDVLNAILCPQDVLVDFEQQRRRA